MNLNPYLTFDGECRAAMTFYQACLGGDLNLMTFGDNPGGGVPPGAADRIMHATLVNGALRLMASDGMPGQPVRRGDHVHLSLDLTSREEIDRVFAALGDGGTVTMPLADQSWGGRFGMVVDRFGVPWMFHFDLRRQG